MEYINIIIAGYLYVSLTKILISLPGAYISAIVITRHDTSGMGFSLHLIISVLALILASLVMWPYFLRYEGWSFFTIPSNRQVVRQILIGMK